MRKLFKLLVCIILISMAFELWSVCNCKEIIKNSISELPVFSYSKADTVQNKFSQIKDAVATYLQPILDSLPDKERVVECFQKHFGELVK